MTRKFNSRLRTTFMTFWFIAVVAFLTGAKAPLMLKMDRYTFFVESDAATICAFESESGQLLWIRNLAKDWKEDWQRPLHGFKSCSVVSLIPGTDEYAGYLVIELNDGKVGFIQIKDGNLKSPIND